MDINDFLVRKRVAVPSLMPHELRVQRLWIDGRDRWVSLSRRAAEQELQERFGDWHAALARLETGHEIHTASARYRAVAAPQADT
jgi:hypothetical protein